MNGVNNKCENGATEVSLCDRDNDKQKQSIVKKPAPLRTVSWNEAVEESELDIPGTPRTPRTSTTPGILKISKKYTTEYISKEKKKTHT